MENQSRLGRLLDILKLPFGSREPRLSPQAEAIKQNLLNSLNGKGFQVFRDFLTPEEERQYLELIPSVVEREERLQAEYPSKIKPPGWQMTHPLTHDPDNFRYIVHTIINTKNDYVASLRGEPRREYPTREWTDLGGFLSRNMTSCTLVDELHRGTYVQDQVPHGFILDVPEENIVAIHPFDMGKPWDIQDKHEGEQALKGGITRKNNTASAQEFFDNGVHSLYNEIVVDGIGPKRRQISISGVFLIVDPILEIPLYEFDIRLSRRRQKEVAELLRQGYREKHVVPERWYINRMKERYQQAKDLAQLLAVPIIHIPANLGPNWCNWYRKYILPKN